MQSGEGKPAAGLLASWAAPDARARVDKEREVLTWVYRWSDSHGSHEPATDPKDPRDSFASVPPEFLARPPDSHQRPTHFEANRRNPSLPGGPPGSRTRNRRVKSPLLCQLS